MQEFDHAPTRVTLSPPDAAALDAAIEAMSDGPTLKFGSDEQAMQGQAESAAPDGTAPDQSEAISRVLGLIGLCPAQDPPDDLVERTLARVAEARQNQRFAHQISSLGGGSSQFRWSDLMAFAAVLMIGVSLLWPALERSRASARQLACAQNLAAAGMAIGSYAADHQGTVPRGNVQPGSIWWKVGQPVNPAGQIQSNSAHLYILVRDGYISPNTLNCPDNCDAPHHMDMLAHDWNNAAAVSYSYQNQYTPRAARLELLGEMALLADKNPLFKMRTGKRASMSYQDDLSEETASTFHDNQGQNVLLADGRVIWTKVPILASGDNIWLLKGVKRYSGNEAPEDHGDSFLVP